MVATDKEIASFRQSLEQRYKPQALQGLYNAYERVYGDIMDLQGVTSPEARELYVWGEILADAASLRNDYGTQASLYYNEAADVLGIGRDAAPDAAADYGLQLPGLEDGQNAAAYRDIRGSPAERYSSNGNNTKQTASSPLSGSPSSQKGGFGTDKQVTADAELLGIDVNKAQESDSVKNALVVLAGNEYEGGVIVATFDLNNDLFGETAHKCTSIHPRASIEGLINNLGPDAKVFVINEEKFASMMAGLHTDISPQLLATDELLIGIIRHDNEAVKHFSPEQQKARIDQDYLAAVKVGDMKTACA